MLQECMDEKLTAAGRVEKVAQRDRWILKTPPKAALNEKMAHRLILARGYVAGGQGLGSGYCGGTVRFVAAVKRCTTWTLARHTRMGGVVSASIVVVSNWSCCISSPRGSWEVILRNPATEANSGLGGL